MKSNVLIKPPIGVELVGSRAKAFQCASAILDIAHWLPERRLSSLDVEKLVNSKDKTPGWLEKMTGVKERRICDPGLAISEMAAIPSLQVMNRQNIQPAAIDVVIYAGMSREVVNPATANLVAKAIGAKTATCFDVSSACLGFVDALLLADAIISTRRVRTILVVTAEQLAHYIDQAIEAINKGEGFDQLIDALAFGDGAAAALIVPPNHPRAKLRMMSAIRESYSEFSDACKIQAVHRTMNTDTPTFVSSSLKQLPPLFDELLNFNELDVESIDFVVPHQANRKFAEKSASLVGDSREKLAISLENYGNMSSASVPVTLSEAISQGRSRKGGHAVITGFGPGLGIGLINLKRNI